MADNARFNIATERHLWVAVEREHAYRIAASKCEGMHVSAFEASAKCIRNAEIGERCDVGYESGESFYPDFFIITRVADAVRDQ